MCAFDGDIDRILGTVAQVEPGVGLTVPAREPDLELHALEPITEPVPLEHDPARDHWNREGDAAMHTVVNVIGLLVTTRAPGGAFVDLPGGSFARHAIRSSLSRSRHDEITSSRTTDIKHRHGRSVACARPMDESEWQPMYAHPDIPIRVWYSLSYHYFKLVW